MYYKITETGLLPIINICLIVKKHLIFELTFNLKIIMSISYYQIDSIFLYRPMLVLHII